MELGISERPKTNSLPPTENPQKYFPTSKTLKYPQIHYSFRKNQAWYDNNGDPWLLKNHVNKTGPLKNTIENIKHFKIQFLFNNIKNTAAVTTTQKT